MAIRGRKDVPCFLGGVPGVCILIRSTLDQKLQSCLCLPTFAAQSGCWDVCAAATWRNVPLSGGRRACFMCWVFQLCLLHLCEHSGRCDVPPRAQSHSLFSSIDWRAPPTCCATAPETPHPFYPPRAAFCSAGINFLSPDLLFHPSRNQPPSKVSEMQCQARTHAPCQMNQCFCCLATRKRRISF